MKGIYEDQILIAASAASFVLNVRGKSSQLIDCVVVVVLVRKYSRLKERVTPWMILNSVFIFVLVCRSDHPCDTPLYGYRVGAQGLLLIIFQLFFSRHFHPADLTPRRTASRARQSP